MYLNVCSSGSDTVWEGLEVWPCWNRCSLTGVGVALLEEVWGGLGGVKGPSQAQWLSVFLMSMDPDVGLSAPSPFLPACHHASVLDDNGLNL